MNGAGAENIRLTSLSTTIHYVIQAQRGSRGCKAVTAAIVDCGGGDGGVMLWLVISGWVTKQPSVDYLPAADSAFPTPYSYS